MIGEAYPDNITRARWEMDAAANHVERAWLRERWLRLREEEQRQSPLAVRQLKERGLYSLQELVDAYGGLDAFIKFTTERAA